MFMVTCSAQGVEGNWPEQRLFLFNASPEQRNQNRQAIRNVFTAFANLAASINALAHVIQTATTKLEMQIGAADNQETHVLEHEPAAVGNGRRRKQRREGCYLWLNELQRPGEKLRRIFCK